MVGLRRSSRPEWSSAVTDAYRGWAGSGMTVSKPRCWAIPSGRNWLCLDPAATCQPVTSVAPFQLAYTIEVPLRRSRPASTAGRWCGLPLHGRHSPR